MDSYIETYDIAVLRCRFQRNMDQIADGTRNNKKSEPVQRA